ncbi:hypothetical protein KBZ18_11130 [Synechococcus sp. Cruz-9H2]|uniref:hypothetical protein n=1 Tax=unclassified Synechococcus TaxID=2626047 RepID=UPI0020CF30F4|nr:MULTISPECIES: hypothetical protein [unclassified Synechococcus]MCP9820042.1 hypothetical protein [Synechococcus sp. Cruz-9H2]MCP9844348.1 hypothetical protein [Synechococcus sp. Edmonson 11F2]MCP9856472.1 hypothetical protein [Synechococcus sp. Cruz-9C9]MCP9863753.1 hypothetical protein [Synechococcus sp. Cruz-7E5]MCP9870952.1 hypothetical protein [Synechococcus sp. Cruz-7B9]
MPSWVARIDRPRRELQEIVSGQTVGPAVVMLAFDELGSDALVQAITTNVASWITLYNSEAAYQADNLRPVNQDPEPGSGVVADVRFPTLGGGVLRLAPGTSYSNAEVPAQNRMLARLRVEQTGLVTPVLAIDAVVLVD